MRDARTNFRQLSGPSTFVVANEMQETVGQCLCLREHLIHLCDPIQLLLYLRTQHLGTGQHPPDDLRLLSRLQGVSEELTQAKQASPASVAAPAI